jgi:hypothetical protein
MGEIASDIARAAELRRHILAQNPGFPPREFGKTKICVRFDKSLHCGEMAEWLKAHAWKACIPQGIQGSNPCLSATDLESTTCDFCYSLGYTLAKIGKG